MDYSVLLGLPLNVDCPHCGQSIPTLLNDFNDDVIKENNTFKFYIYCQNCDIVTGGNPSVYLLYNADTGEITLN